MSDAFNRPVSWAHLAGLTPPWVSLPAHLFGVFLARHWLLALANAGLTTAFGLGLLALARRLSPARGGTTCYLRLRRCVLLAALVKSAFYLVVGDGHRSRHSLVGLGFQVPSPLDVLHMVPRTSFTVWRPTAATEQVGLLLAGGAFLLLLWRGRQVAVLLSWLAGLAQIYPAGAACPASDQVGAVQARAAVALRRAAAALGQPPDGALPVIVLSELSSIPLLLGGGRTYLVLPPALAAVLTDHELEMVLRHELAHLRRGDHRWRWLLLWVEDFSRVNPLASWLSREAMALEETFCDRMAVTSARDAAALARALSKCRSLPWPSLADGPPLPSAVLPMLIGTHPQSGQEAAQRRLADLLVMAQGYAPRERAGQAEPGEASSTWLLPLRRASVLAGDLVLGSLLALVSYTKFLLIVNLS